MYQKILAPLDGSELSEHSLPHVKAIAKACGVPQIILLRVIEPFPVDGYEVDRDLVHDSIKRGLAMAEKYLSTVADNLKKDGITARVAVTSGNAAEEILNYAKKNAVDLIIMSTHGRAGVTRWVFGSVAERVMRHATVPVLTVPPAGSRQS